MTVTNETLKAMPLSGIANVISANWPKVYFGAVPYLEAMGTLNSVKDNYYADSGSSVVYYFLANATGWRGEVAKMVKAELKSRVKS